MQSQLQTNLIAGTTIGRAKYEEVTVNMRSDQPGKVCEGLWYLGRPESGVYWLQGSDGALLISGGTSYIAADVTDQIQRFGLHENELDGILILHAHFDHIGVVPYFKRRHPDLTIYASERAWELLTSQRVIETVNEFSRALAERMGMAEVLSTLDLDWRKGLSGKVVSEGDLINLGGREIRVFETPGHSSCSVSVYAAAIKALFPSDGGGIPYRGTILSAGNSNYTQYQQSLQRLQELDVDYLCADHYGYLWGDEARTFIRRSIEAAAVERKRMEEIFVRSGDMDTAVQEITETILKENPEYFLPADIYIGIVRQMMRHLSECMHRPSD